MRVRVRFIISEIKQIQSVYIGVYHLHVSQINKQLSTGVRARFRSSEAPCNCDCRAPTAPYSNYINNCINMLLKATRYCYSPAIFFINLGGP